MFQNPPEESKGNTWCHSVDPAAKLWELMHYEYLSFSDSPQATDLQGAGRGRVRLLNLSLDVES